MEQLKKKKGFWLAIFIIILFLTQIELVYTLPVTISWLGLPSWIWYFMGVHVIFAGGLYFFSKEVD